VCGLFMDGVREERHLEGVKGVGREWRRGLLYWSRETVDSLGALERRRWRGVGELLRDCYSSKSSIGLQETNLRPLNRVNTERPAKA